LENNKNNCLQFSLNQNQVWNIIVTFCQIIRK
jgi:hypothetical protein